MKNEELKQVSSCPYCGGPVYMPRNFKGQVDPVEVVRYSCQCRIPGRKFENADESKEKLLLLG